VDPIWNYDCHTFEQVARQLVKAIGCSTTTDGDRRPRATTASWRRRSSPSRSAAVSRILAEIGLRVTVAES
jgi:hypothetical protein